MAIQSLSTIPASITDLSQSNPQVNQNRTSLWPNGGNQQTAPAQRSIGLSAEYYSSDTMSMQFSNKDGDTVTLSMQHVEYAKAQIQVKDNGSMSDEDWKKIVDKIKDEYKSLQGEIMKKFIEATGGTTQSTDTAPNPSTTGAGTTQGTQDAQVPDYWNAENTSKRIADFATSFFSGFQGAGADFLNKIKDAIDEGFKQAKGELGKVSDPISSLMQHTHDLIMQKLDEWAKTQGINLDSSTDDAATAAQSTAQTDANAQLADNLNQQVGTGVPA